ncbi:MAG: DUF4252 domain-containing protein [Pseudomonadota bacterium]
MRPLLGVAGVLIASVFTMSLVSYAQDSKVSGNPGYFEFSAIEGSYGDPSVTINLNKSLLKLLGAFEHDDPEAAEAIKNLELVRIQVYEELDESGSYSDADQQMLTMRASLDAASWDRVVEARDEEERVDIYVKQDGEAIQGIVVMALDEEDAVFINILGNIQPEQISAIVDHVDIDLDLSF